MPEHAKLLLLVLCAFGIAICCYGMFAVALEKKTRSLSEPGQEIPSEDDSRVLPEE